MKTTAPKKKAFSRFKLDEAYRLLKLKHLTPWQLEFTAITASAAFQLHQERMQVFDLQRSEEGKKILIDAILIEAIQSFKRLKIWKGMSLESEVAHGAADYLVTENLGYFEAPLLCVIEAKKDDFEQGLAQCLVELQACQQTNHAIARSIDVFGIVTNGSTWQFYKSMPSGEVYESLPYAVSELSSILGILHILFQQCEQNLE
jgi:hypothetical protein